MSVPRPEGGSGGSPPDSTRSSVRRTARRLALSIVGLVGLGIVIGTGAAVTRPGWYRPRSIDFRVLANDKAELLALENRISEALNANRSVTVDLEDAQVNRWLAARHDLLANLIALPVDLERPCVRFDASGIELATTRALAGGTVVLSARGRPRIDGESVRLENAHAAVGRLAVPLGWVLPWLPAACSRGGALDLPNLRMSRTFVWTNGERQCQLTEIECRPGVVRVTLAPVDGTAGARRPAP